MSEPDYACAVIEDAGRLLLELRPLTAQVAAGRLTCFGGRRETGEDAERCLRRELQEELGIVVDGVSACAELHHGPHFIARFYRTAWPGDGAAPRCRHGARAVWCPWRALPGLPLSPWHAAVLAALRAGRADVPRVDVARTSLDQPTGSP